MHLPTLPDRRPTPKLPSFVQFVTERLGDGALDDDLAREIAALGGDSVRDRVR